jgi:hypothetical protein
MLTGNGRATGHVAKKSPDFISRGFLITGLVGLVLHLDALVDELAILHHLQVVEASWQILYVHIASLALLLYYNPFSIS